MKQLLFVCVILISISAFSQNVPDRELIEQEITDQVSQFYYPRLMERYERNDTTLTPEEYRYLYYGYVFQDGYKPLLKTNYVDSLNRVFSSRYAATGDEFSRIERYARAILSVEPFNLRDINVLAYSYQQIGYKAKAEEQRYKLEMLAEVIKSTGSGLSDTSPWHIIYPDHAEDILNLMNIEPGRKIIVSRSVEFFSAKNSPDKSIKGYYFDYSEIYNKRPDYLEEVGKPKRKLDINPVPKDNQIK